MPEGSTDKDHEEVCLLEPGRSFETARKRPSRSWSRRPSPGLGENIKAKAVRPGSNSGPSSRAPAPERNRGSNGNYSIAACGDQAERRGPERRQSCLGYRSHYRQPALRRKLDQEGPSRSGVKHRHGGWAAGTSGGASSASDRRNGPGHRRSRRECSPPSSTPSSYRTPWNTEGIPTRTQTAITIQST